MYGDLVYHKEHSVHLQNFCLALGMILLILEFLKAGVVGATNSRGEFWRATKIFQWLYIFLQDIPILIILSTMTEEEATYSIFNDVTMNASVWYIFVSIF